MCAHSYTHVRLPQCTGCEVDVKNEGEHRDDHDDDDGLDDDADEYCEDDNNDDDTTATTTNILNMMMFLIVCNIASNDGIVLSFVIDNNFVTHAFWQPYMRVCMHAHMCIYIRFCVHTLCKLSSLSSLFSARPLSL